MDHLWAPWRLAYVTQPNRPQPTTGETCFICRAQAESDDRSNLILQRNRNSCVILNRFPYNNGHLLIAPRTHHAGLEDLSPEVLLEMQLTLQQMLKILSATIRPDGFNVGLNLGRVAGAGLPGHLHWHIVPRWNGDTNFMPVLADVKVIVQSLDALYDLLRNALNTTTGNSAHAGE
ncbi:MAG: HIT domain-containing protein [Bacteroidales bacterium]|nr:HIT domain-containing protein [Bacteroidales bacterium]